MNKKTKIIATLGPASFSEETIKQLGESGVNIFRLNTKHADPEWHLKAIETIRKVEHETSELLGVLVDLQGPEIRLETRDKIPVSVPNGSTTKISTEFGNDIDIILPEKVIKVLKKGDQFLIDDGFLEFEVVSNQHNVVLLKALQESLIQHRKGVNLPGKKIDLPSLTKRDKQMLDAIKDSNPDFIALSFVRTKTDLEILRKYLKKIGIKSKVLSKIESQEALNNINEIISASDGIMIARGDLGVEVPFEQLAYWQSEITKRSRLKARPVIVATQMLDSMVNNPRPTRAEVTDVANAVLDGADALMLSAETASGNHVVKVVKTMDKIISFNEGRVSGFQADLSEESETELMVDSAMNIAREDHGPAIDRIIVFTETGLTARLMSRYRPNTPIVAVSDHKESVRSLILSYAVKPIYMKLPQGAFRLTDSMMKKLKKTKVIEKNQKVLIIHGQHWQIPGQANAMMILNT